jgi:hypothetical protein
MNPVQKNSSITLIPKWFAICVSVLEENKEDFTVSGSNLFRVLKDDVEDLRKA